MTIVFVASAAMTIVWCRSMSAMGEMAMPGGWTMSHMWMVMPGQTLSGATASFVGMWVVMMVAMMLPSLTPALLRCRESLGSGRAVIVGVGYFSTWAALGTIVFPLGSALASLAMRQSAVARAVPIGVAAVVIIAGVVQCTAWKARQLALCREAAGHGRTLSGGGMGAAWRHGWCLGTHCVQSCAGLTTVMLALGVMDLRVMAAATAAITLERLAPNGGRRA
jgi:predicted metal-binding membrane protein